VHEALVLRSRLVAGPFTGHVVALVHGPIVAYDPTAGDASQRRGVVASRT
jgi:hypothetical protein